MWLGYSECAVLHFLTYFEMKEPPRNPSSLGILLNNSYDYFH